MPTKSEPPQIEVAEAAARCQQSGVPLLDVREDDEWAAGHAPHAEHCPLGELNPAEYQKGDTVIAVCRSGNRSQKAAVALHNAGVTAYNLTGGMLAWARSGQPVVRDDGTSGRVP